MQCETLPLDFSKEVDLSNAWLHLENPSDREIELIMKQTGAPEDMLKAALDVEEQPRFEIDEDSDSRLILFDIPKSDEGTMEDGKLIFKYTTVPFAIIVVGTTIISIVSKGSAGAIVNHFQSGGNKKTTTSDVYNFVFQLLLKGHQEFISALNLIDKRSTTVKNELRKSTKNTQLIQLLELTNSLVYFINSLKRNGEMCKKIYAFSNSRDGVNAEILEDDRGDIFNDAQIELQQAYDTADMQRQILTSTMDAYASVISNNLNISMRKLTIFTVLLAVPTLIFSLWGINTGVPFGGEVSGFWFVLGLSVLAIIITVILLFFGDSITRAFIEGKASAEKIIKEIKLKRREKRTLEKLELRKKNEAAVEESFKNKRND